MVEPFGVVLEVVLPDRGPLARISRLLGNVLLLQEIFGEDVGELGRTQKGEVLEFYSSQLLSKTTTAQV